jgi:hypothetical protein
MVKPPLKSSQEPIEEVKNLFQSWIFPKLYFQIILRIFLVTEHITFVWLWNDKNSYNWHKFYTFLVYLSSKILIL